MQRGRSPVAGILASVVLAFFTISVFSKSQLRGPEGTINRYFSAILARNFNAAAQLCNGNEMQFVGVTNSYLQLFLNGAQFKIVDVVRTNDTARAGLVFFIQGEELPAIIVLRRIRKQWMIDLGPTISPYRRMTT